MSIHPKPILILFVHYYHQESNPKNTFYLIHILTPYHRAIGGTKGSSALGFATLAAVSQILITEFLEYIPPQFLSLANDTFPGLIDLPLGDPSSLSNFHLNLEDTIPQHDEVSCFVQREISLVKRFY